jgi:hypothetical protein
MRKKQPRQSSKSSENHPTESVRMVKTQRGLSKLLLSLGLQLNITVQAILYYRQRPMTESVHVELNSTHGSKDCSIADSGAANITGGGLYYM